jgi:hypothetical protein
MGEHMLRRSIVICLSALVATLAPAKDKNKIALPAQVLNARTVLVVVKPGAGEPLTNPGANQNAQVNVEKALMKWGRFTPALEPTTADLIIAVRKGTGRGVSPTVTGGPIDQRPVIVEPTDGDIRIGGQRGKPPDLTSTDTGTDAPPHIQTEVGPSNDVFEVYRGGLEEPLDAAPVWRYIAKDALNAPNVPAVEQFRKAVNEAMKAANNKKPQP